MEKNKETKTLSPKLDVVFQALFGEIGNERITKGFLETILKRKIESIDLSKNPILRREFKDDKLGVLDILAELDGKEKCNIEMQLIDQSNIIERILYYWSRLYTRQIKTGEDYSLLEKTIVILITDFEVKNLKEMDYHSVWKIMDNKTGGKILTDKLEIDIIELPKIKGREKDKDKLLDWLYFLENPKSERVTEKMGENKEIKEATEKLDSLSEDERMQRIADLRLKAIMDEKAIYAKGLEDGEKKREEELKERIEELRQKAIMDEKAIYAKGLEDGKRKREEELQEKIAEMEERIETIAKKMLEQKIDKKITKGFLETILKRKIESIDLSKNPILRREFKDDKLGVLDILAELDGKEKCNIEMQLIDQSNIIERILYYWSRLYTRQIKTGEDYSLLEKTIVILITDFEVKNLKEMDYHSVWKIMDNKTGGKILTDKLEIDIIELPKIKGREKDKDKLLDWLYFLENPKSERVTEKMGENKEIKEATEKLDSLSEDERMQRIADLRLKAIMDEKAIYAKGLEKGKLEVAKKMLELKISKETIAKATGLTMQEIENISI